MTVDDALARIDREQLTVAELLAIRDALVEEGHGRDVADAVARVEALVAARSSPQHGQPFDLP